MPIDPANPRASKSTAPAQAGGLDAAAGVRPMPLASLFPHHATDPGETILLISKPSLLIMLREGLPWAAGCWFLAGVMQVLRLPLDAVVVGMICGLLALSMGLAEWLGRWYVLTDRRALMVRGIVARRIWQVSLIEIERVEIKASALERFLRLATVRIHAQAAGHGTGCVKKHPPTHAGVGFVLRWSWSDEPGILADAVERARRRYGMRS